jgi:hypothetical protein
MTSGMNERLVSDFYHLLSLNRLAGAQGDRFPFLAQENLQNAFVLCCCLLAWPVVYMVIEL